MTKAFDDFIWDTYNKPWLESALQRGDDIVIWSDPINLKKTEYIDGVIGPSFTPPLARASRSCAQTRALNNNTMYLE